MTAKGIFVILQRPVASSTAASDPTTQAGKLSSRRRCAEQLLVTYLDILLLDSGIAIVIRALFGHGLGDLLPADLVEAARVGQDGQAIVGVAESGCGHSSGVLGVILNSVEEKVDLDQLRQSRRLAEQRSHGTGRETYIFGFPLRLAHALFLRFGEGAIASAESRFGLSEPKVCLDLAI
jgi:hypothetical protein